MSAKHKNKQHSKPLNSGENKSHVNKNKKEIQNDDKQSKKNKKTLFADEEEEVMSKDQEKLNINKDFAKRFEHNKRRELLEQGKQLYGEKALKLDEDKSSESESEEEEEDEEADLINPHFEKKFLETIAMIRNNDPKLKDLKEELFKDEDFEDDLASQVQKKDKKFTYKDKIRQDALKDAQRDDSDVGDSDSDNDKGLFKKRKGNKETIAEEEERLKKEFKLAGKVKDVKSKMQIQDSSEEDQGNDSDGDDFLKRKTNDVEEEEEDKIPDNIEQLKLDQILNKKGKKREMKLVTDEDLLKRFWGDDKSLDSKDKFLRNYILLEGWKDKFKGVGKTQEQIDREDEDRDVEMEQFEEKYNFRFEDSTGTYITTHSREVPESMRRKDDTRKDKRLEKKERQEDEKRRKQEEINKLKQLKREEILEKLKKAEFLSGYDHGQLEERKLLEKAEKELKTEFIPELYDKTMGKMFDDKYYEQEDKKAKKVVGRKDLDLKLMNDDDHAILSDEDDQEILDEYEQMELEDDGISEDNIQKTYEQELAKSIKKQVKENKKKKDELELEVLDNYDTWFACDGCNRAIEAGEYRFDCATCDNFSFCEKCYKKNKNHLHKFTREKIPPSNKPPKNKDDLIEKAYMLCHKCKECLLEASKRVYICRECSKDFDGGDVMYFCLKCKEADAHPDHKLEKLKVLPGQNAQAKLMKKDKEKMSEEEKRQYLDNLLDEYYNLEFEDVIGGGEIKTRFKYVKVPQADFGLTEDEILLLDDKQLNKLVSLKKYRAYMDSKEPMLKEDEREEGEIERRKRFEIEGSVNIHRVINLKKQYKQELEEKKKLLKQALITSVEQEKEKFFKGSTADKHKFQAALELSKNKLRKQKRKERDEDSEKEDGEIDNDSAQVIEDENTKKKRKRMALYGIKK